MYCMYICMIVCTYVGFCEVEPLQEDEADIVGSAEASSCMVEIHVISQYNFFICVIVCTYA
jgi:hypothetical protein